GMHGSAQRRNGLLRRTSITLSNGAAGSILGPARWAIWPATVNMPFRALKLGYPNVVECEMASRTYPETFPKTSRIRFEFPEREGLPPLKFWWYDGNPKDALRPLRPEAKAIKEIISTYDDLPESGALII